MQNLRIFVGKIENRLLFFLILIAGLLAARTLFGGDYFIMHDDLQMMRQLTLEKCILDSQIPCRWSQDMGYGFGYPLFNFYPPLPYIFGQTFRILGFAFTQTVKLNFAFSLIFSGFSMYFLAKKFYGKLGSILASVFYVWAPYRAVDVYVRGAMNEGWSFVFMPLILLFSYLIIVDKEKLPIKKILLLALSYASLFLTHNLIVLIFTPFFTLWCLIWILKYNNFKSILNMAFSVVWSLGMAAFFTIPAFFEKNLVHIETLASDYYEFFAHFASLNQLLLSRFWGDGPSVFGANDGLALPVGNIHWVLSLVILFLLGINYLKNKKITTLELVIIFSVFIGWFGTFMSHQKSSPIWFSITTLKYVQFPWRFLTISVLGMSIASGGIVEYASRLFPKNIVGKISAKTINVFITIFLLIGVIIWNWHFFEPVRSGPTSDEERFSGEAWRIQQGAGIRDYLPLTAKDDPDVQRGNLVDIINGNATIFNIQEGTYWSLFETESKQESTLRINTFYFPNWRVFIKDENNSEELEVFIPEGEGWGRMWVNIPPGEHLIYVQLFNTPIRIWSNVVSFISWVGLVVVLFRSKINKDLF